VAKTNLGGPWLAQAPPGTATAIIQLYKTDINILSM